MNEDIVVGIHAVHAALNNKTHTFSCLFVQKGRDDKRMKDVLKKAKALEIAFELLPKVEMDKRFSAYQHQGVVLQLKKAKNYSELDIPDLLVQASGALLILVLDGITDPHNLGACLRSADAAGVHMVIAPKDNNVGLTPAVKKVASGAAETIPFIQVTNLARTIKQLQEFGVWVHGAASESDNTLYDIDLKGNVAIVMGAEGKGLRRLTRETCDDLFAIPMTGTVESLNVSVATGICLFEAKRQRG